MMSKKKDTELFELIKRDDFKLKPLAKKEEPDARVETGDSLPDMTSPRQPFLETSSETREAYPKFKSSFKKKSRVQTTGEKTFTVKYNTAIFIMILVIITIFISFMLGGYWERRTLTGTGSAQTTGRNRLGVTPGSGSQPDTNLEIPLSPVGSTYWTVRLRRYQNDRSGRNSSDRAITKLGTVGIRDVEKRKEKVGGLTLWVIYAGKFSRSDQAHAAVKEYRRLYRNFDRDFKVIKIEKKNRRY